MIFDASGREYVRAIGFESKLRPKHGGAEAADCVSGYSIEVDSAESMEECDERVNHSSPQAFE